MVKKHSFMWLLFIVVISLVTCFLGCSIEQEESQLHSGAFDFSLKTIEGEEIRLKDYRGKKIVHLVFWATWCPACIIEIPKLKKLHHATGDKPYEILAIDIGLNDSIQRVRQVQARYQMPYKILFDEKGAVSRMYGVIGIPTQIIIDKEGTIKDQFNQLPENPEIYLAKLFPRQK